MVNLITKENIEDVLREAFKHLEKANSILLSPGCDCDEVGEFRCEASRAIDKAMDEVRIKIHQCYTLR